MNLKQYLDAANAAEARVQTIAAQIDQHFTANETDKALALKPDLEKAQADAKQAHELYVAMQNTTGGGTDPAQRIMPSGRVEVIRDEADQPFENDGQFFLAVKQAATHPALTDRRLLRFKPQNAVQGMSEGVPADGGYLLSPQVNNNIMEKMYSIGEVLRRISVDPLGAGKNSVTYNGVDETSRVAGSRWGGVRGYWVEEAGDITGSHPKFYQLEIKPKKVAALCYATDEQLQDTANLASWLGRVVPDELRFMAEDAIVEGDGVGKPLGILNAPCLISVLRYATSTVSFIDIVNMWARRYPSASGYVWLINQDVEPQIDQMSLSSSLAVPPGFFGNANGYLTMKNAPVVPVEYCQTMGTKGDILLASLPLYQAADMGGVQSASSIHVEFVTDQTAFRFTYRIDGEPAWHSALTPLHGSNTVSPFVALATATA